ncbi:MAG: PilX N-terminal domain-containing pilus assembly protein [Litorivicinaceae bacterium]
MRQRGFALMFSLVLLPVMAALLVWLLQSVHLIERVEGHQRTDRAAYAASSQFAAELNAMATSSGALFMAHPSACEGGVSNALHAIKG